MDWYRARWEIELFFLILKEGCRIEVLQLGQVERIETALAMYMVVAWRINRLMRLGRSLPELPADLLFESDEWRAVYVLKKKKPPKAVPPLNIVTRLIAQLRGSWRVKATVNQGPRRFGWACGTLPYSCRDCASLG